MHIPNILPLLFIGLWIVLSLAGNKQRKAIAQKRREAHEAEKHREPDATPAHENSRKKTLFGDMGHELEEFTQQLQNIDKDEPGPLDKRESATKQYYAVAPATAPKAVAQGKIPEVVSALPHNAATPAAASTTPQASPHGVSIKRLQQAVIWSEVLAKPLALRDE